MAPNNEPVRSQRSAVGGGGSSGSSNRDVDDEMADAPSRLTSILPLTERQSAH